MGTRWDTCELRHSVVSRVDSSQTKSCRCVCVCVFFCSCVCMLTLVSCFGSFFFCFLFLGTSIHLWHSKSSKTRPTKPLCWNAHLWDVLENHTKSLDWWFSCPYPRQVTLPVKSFPSMEDSHAMAITILFTKVRTIKEICTTDTPTRHQFLFICLFVC